MATRTIVSCDWCGVESGVGGEVGDSWQYVYADAMGEDAPGDDALLCATCLKAAKDALTRVRQERKAAGAKT